MSIEQEEIILAYLLTWRNSLGSKYELVQEGIGENMCGQNINNALNFIHLLSLCPVVRVEIPWMDVAGLIQDGIACIVLICALPIPTC